MNHNFFLKNFKFKLILILCLLISQSDRVFSQIETCNTCVNPQSEVEESKIVTIGNGIDCYLTINYKRRICTDYYDLMIKSIVFESGSDCSKLSVEEIFNIAIVKLILSNPFNLPENSPISKKMRIISYSCWKKNVAQTQLESCVPNICCTTTIKFEITATSPISYSIELPDKPCVECQSNEDCKLVCTNGIFEKFADYFKTTTTVSTNDCSDFRVDAGKDISICPNSDGVQLNATGGDSYTWDPTDYLNYSNISNPIANPPESNCPITYTVTSLRGGCEATDKITVTCKTNIIAYAGNDVTICEGENVQLQATGGVNYYWSPSIGLSNRNISNPIAKPLYTTTYTVTVTDGTCNATAQVTVTVCPTPTVSGGFDRTICPGECVDLNAVTIPGVTYEWNPKIGLSNPNNPDPKDPDYLQIPNPIACPKEPTCYTLTVRNNCKIPACEATTKFCISISGWQSKKMVYALPTTINNTPGDTVLLQFTIVPDLDLLPVTHFQMKVQFDSTQLSILPNFIEMVQCSNCATNVQGFEAWDLQTNKISNNTILITGIGIPLLNPATYELKVRVNPSLNVLTNSSALVGYTYDMKRYLYDPCLNRVDVAPVDYMSVQIVPYED